MHTLGLPGLLLLKLIKERVVLIESMRSGKVRLKLAIVDSLEFW